MKNENKIKLFLVDDDALFLKSLEIEFLEHADFEIETYATGELCIENLSKNPDAIILDYQLDGIDKSAMNGIDTLDKIKAYNLLIETFYFNPESTKSFLNINEKILEMMPDAVFASATAGSTRTLSASGLMFTLLIIYWYLLKDFKIKVQFDIPILCAVCLLSCQRV